MQILNPNINFDNFLIEIQNKDSKLLLLDYDGTLAPFHVNPLAAVPYAGVVELLDKIMIDLKTRVIVITGRWTKDIKFLLPLKNQPEIWGTHGIERLKPDGTYMIDKMDPRALQGLAEADYWLSSGVHNLKYRYEQKPGSLALHWRGLKNSQIKKIRLSVDRKFEQLSRRFGLLVKEFKGNAQRNICSLSGG
jgi:trehalose 6-phosphate phosphatase